MADQPQKMKAGQRRPDVYKQWMAGCQMADIADRYSVTIRQIYRDLATHRRQMLREHVDVQAHVLRQLEDLQVLRAKTLKLLDTAEGRAKMLKLMEREARLLGLDAPAKKAIDQASGVEVKGGGRYQLEVGDDVLEIVRALGVAADGDELEAAYTRDLPNASVRRRPRWEILDLNQ